MTHHQMVRVRKWAGIGATGALLAGLLPPPGTLEAQDLTYLKGQTISPAYEGWVEKADGSRAFLFGYMNRNWEETPDIPVGPENYLAHIDAGKLDDLDVDGFDASRADQGQPTHFLPRRNRHVFEVPVPEEFEDDDELVWTLVSQGETRRAYSSLHRDYFLDNVTIMSETGALGGGVSTPEVRANVPPTVELEGMERRSVKVGEPLTLSAIVTDDGVPGNRDLTVSRRSPQESPNPINEDGTLNLEKALRKPDYGTVGKRNGLHHSWFVYRQPPGATVAFDPPQIEVWEDVRPWTNSPWSDYWEPPALPEDARWVARATFDTPGVYLIRGRADDGGLWKDVDVVVDVSP